MYHIWPQIQLLDLDLVAVLCLKLVPTPTKTSADDPILEHMCTTSSSYNSCLLQSLANNRPRETAEDSKSFCSHCGPTIGHVFDTVWTPAIFTDEAPHHTPRHRAAVYPTLGNFYSYTQDHSMLQFVLIW